jgi:transcriptional regulator with GAF, ATPase, and Fis domain
MSGGQQPERFKILYDFACAFAAQLELEELLAMIVQRCRDVFHSEGVAVLLLDADKNELYFPYVADQNVDVARRLMSIRFPADAGIAGAALASGRSEVIADTAKDPRFYGKVDDSSGQKTRSMLVAPLLTRRGPIGVIEVVNRLGGATFTTDDLELLDALAGSIAVAIDNARMFAELRDREERLRSTVGALRRDMARQDQFGEIVGTSPAINEVLRLMESAASSPISVLIEGETGTGKELVARGIHRASDRADAPFIAVNCAALPADLLEAELFGHARGAFTGATGDRRGLFEAAHGGSIFLDEIGDLPLSMQVKLLRVLQEGEITPVGTTKVRKVDVRVISATNRNLRTSVDQGVFRADLFYRVSAFPIPVPALRARLTDIPQLADRFLAQASETHRKRVPGFEPEAFAVLAGYSWPGNIRQLKNEIERAVALTRAEHPISANVFSADVSSCAPSAETAEPSARARVDGLPRVEAKTVETSSLREARAVFESRFIAEQLRARDGNVSRTAEALGISRVMLQKKMKEYGLR